MNFKTYFINFKILTFRPPKSQNSKITDFFPRGPSENGKCSGDFKYFFIYLQNRTQGRKKHAFEFLFYKVFQSFDF